MKWATIHEIMLNEFEHRESNNWLKGTLKPLVLLKNRSCAIMIHFCTPNTQSKFCFCEQFGKDLAPLIPGAMQFLACTLAIIDAKQMLHKAQAQIMVPIEHFWYSLLNEVFDHPIYSPSTDEMDCQVL